MPVIPLYIAHETMKDLVSPYNTIEFVRDRQSKPISSLSLYEATCMEMEKTIKSLNNTIPGTDRIVMDILMASCSNIVTPLTILINESSMQGIFLADLKLAIIIPPHKGGTETLVSNY